MGWVFELIDRTRSKLPFLGAIGSFFIPTVLDPTQSCLNLRTDFDFSNLNTTILDTEYFRKISLVTALGTCQSTVQIGAGVCRVQLVVNTSSSSAVTADAWFPTDWNGRFMGLGNGGLMGCIDYDNLDYGTSMGFATIGTNNGHDGDTGEFFSDPEVLADFIDRSIHVEAIVGKRLVEVYYGHSAQHSYYLGCSTGGRQGMYSAMHHPEDFDGILAGAPATNWNIFLGSSAMITRYIGAPHPEASERFIPKDLWTVVSAEILQQCDELDGVLDGTITEPDDCDFRPEVLLCSDRCKTNCLSKPQVWALSKIYSPLYGPEGKVLFPRFDPGAEMIGMSAEVLFSGTPYMYTDQWMRYAVNVSDFDYSTFNLSHVALMEEIDPGEASTFNGDFSSFRSRGGKVITYHGRMDDEIPSGNAKFFYERARRNLDLDVTDMDEFYRLFLVPGMHHCFGGPGAVNFGQHAGAKPKVALVGVESVNTREPQRSSSRKADNVLTALVDWVERGVTPDHITGESRDERSTRVHCRYPQRSVWDGREFTCVA